MKSPSCIVYVGLAQARPNDAYMQELCAVELAICTGSFLYLVDLLSSVLYCKKQMHVEKAWVRECYFAGIACWSNFTNFAINLPG